MWCESLYWPGKSNILTCFLITGVGRCRSISHAVLCKRCRAVQCAVLSSRSKQWSAGLCDCLYLCWSSHEYSRVNAEAHYTTRITSDNDVPAAAATGRIVLSLQRAQNGREFWELTAWVPCYQSINQSVYYAQGSTIEHSKHRTNIKWRQNEKIKQKFKM